MLQATHQQEMATKQATDRNVPNRIVREGIITSESVDALGWQEEVFYRRLHSVVDDYGRFHATPSLIRAACFPLRLDKVSDSDIGKWLQATEKAGLVRLYQVDRKRYLQVERFGQHVRAKASKFPHPPDGGNADALQTRCTRTASAPVVGDGDVIEDVGELKVGAQAPPAAGAVNGNAVAYIPLNDGSEFGISATQAAEFGKLYPAVDVPQTLNEIRAWNLANPQHRKTRTGVLRHVNRWLAKEQNRG